MGRCVETESSSRGRLDRVWGFQPRPRAASVEEERRFHVQLRVALRIAAGLRSPVTLRWFSGLAGGIEFESTDPSSGSWFRHALAPCYEFGQWRPLARSRVGVASRIRRRARLVSSLELPLPFGPERPPWSDAALRGLASAPDGVCVSFEAWPGPLDPVLSAGPHRSLEPRLPSALDRFSPAPASERAVRDRAEERRVAIPWAVSVGLAARPDLAEDQLERAAGVICAASRLDGGNGLRFPRPYFGQAGRPTWVRFAEPEVAGLFPSPWLQCAGVPPDLESVPGIALGRSQRGGSVRLPVPREEGRHMLILGETGMGKSTLLIRLLRSAAAGGGVVLLDPIGDTGRRFLELLDPAMARRATWVSPTECPVSINALRASSGAAPAPNVSHDRSLHELVTAIRRVRFQKFTEGGFWGPRIEEVLGRAVRVAAALPEGTLADAHALLCDDGPIPDRVPEAAVGELHALRTFVREHPEEVGGSRRVLGEIARNEVLARMLCDPRATFDLRRIGDPGAITVVTADAPAVGEATARYFLATYLALLWAELLSRTIPTKVFLGLEEAQWYVHEGLIELLRLGRRGNIHVWTATHSLRSLPEGLRDALLTNAADLIIFRGDPEEAREFARWSPELSVGRLMALSRGQALAMIGKAAQLEWFHAEPPPRTAPGVDIRDEVRRASLSRWPPRAAPKPDPGQTEESRTEVEVPSGLERSPSEEGAVTYLRELGSSGEGAPRWVTLAEIAARSGCTPADLRRLGARLKRQGVLLRSEHGAAGRRWLLDLARLARGT